MPTIKIRDLPKPCSHPEHNPPSHRVFEPGVYKHTCPGCGASSVFTVQGIYCSASRSKEKRRNYALNYGRRSYSLLDTVLADGPSFAEFLRWSSRTADITRKRKT